jgi:hypothetical protein
MIGIDHLPSCRLKSLHYVIYAPTLRCSGRESFRSSQRCISSTTRFHRGSKDYCEDLFPRKALRSWDSRSAGSGRGPALSPDDKQLWASLADDGVYVYDTATKKISSEVRVIPWVGVFRHLKTHKLTSVSRITLYSRALLRSSCLQATRLPPPGTTMCEAEGEAVHP